MNIQETHTDLECQEWVNLQQNRGHTVDVNTGLSAVVSKDNSTKVQPDFVLVAYNERDIEIRTYNNKSEWLLDIESAIEFYND